MLHRPSAFKKPQRPSSSPPILIFGCTIPSTTFSSSLSAISCAAVCPSPRVRRCISYGSSTIEVPIPQQQAKHPWQSSQPALTISFRPYSLPSEISSKVTFLIIFPVSLPVLSNILVYLIKSNFGFIWFFPEPDFISFWFAFALASPLNQLSHLSDS